MPASRRLLVVVLFALLLPAGKPPIVLDDAQAAWPDLSSRLAVAGHQIPTQKVLELTLADITFGPGDTFVLRLEDDAHLTGTFTRQGAAGRALRLHLDVSGESALLASLGARAAELVAPGASTATEGVLRKIRLTMRLKSLKNADGAVVARITARVAADLALDLPGPDDFPLTVRALLRGTSAPFVPPALADD